MTPRKPVELLINFSTKSVNGGPEIWQNIAALSTRRRVTLSVSRGARRYQSVSVLFIGNKLQHEKPQKVMSEIRRTS